jgi:hypothetical protein
MADIFVQQYQESAHDMPVQLIHTTALKNNVQQ